MSGAASSAAGAASTVTKKFRSPYRTFRRWLRDSEKYKQTVAQRGSKKFTFNICRGDLVQVISGKFAGQQGVVSAVLRKKERIVVKGVNMRTRVTRPTQEAAGFFYKTESPIPYCCVNLVDPTTGKPTSVLKKKVDGSNVRMSSKTGAVIPIPDILKLNKPFKVNPLIDTAAEDVLEETYKKPSELRVSRAKVDPATGKPIINSLGQIELEEEEMELKANRYFY